MKSAHAWDVSKTCLMGSHSFYLPPTRSMPARAEPHLILLYSIGSRGWSSLVVTQPNTNHHIVCAVYCTCVYVRVYCFVRYLISRPILVTIATIFHQLSPRTLQFTIISCNATQTILRPSVLETVRNLRQQSPTVYKLLLNLSTPKG